MEQADFLENELTALAEKGSLSSKKELLKQLASIDLKTFQKQKALLQSPTDLRRLFAPLDHAFKREDFSSQEAAETALKNGEVGCLVLAGGQASRLGLNQPKALFKLGRFSNKSLVQIIAEKVVCASEKYGKSIPVALMVSPLNRDEIENYMRENRWFGLDEKQLFFYEQTMLPLLDYKQSCFLRNSGNIAFGPDGNGHCIDLFTKEGLAKEFGSIGVRSLSVFSIDNPLVDPFDLDFLEMHLQNQNCVSIKGVRRESRDEKVGLLASFDGTVSVAEYSEAKSALQAVGDDGALLYPYGNGGMYLFSLPFVEKSVEWSDQLPLHVAEKTVRVEREERGQRVESQQMCHKFETFIFDHFFHADKVGVLACDKSRDFAPLKSLEGASGKEAVENALLERDRAQFFEVTGIDPGKKVFELDPAFYYPTEEIKSVWSGKGVPQSDYIKA